MMEDTSLRSMSRFDTGSDSGKQTVGEENRKKVTKCAQLCVC